MKITGMLTTLTTLTISAIVHLVLLALMVIVDVPSVSLLENKKSFTEIEIIKNQEPQKIVRNAFLKKDLVRSADTHPARFLSENTQRVKEEVRAKALGITKNLHKTRTSASSNSPTSFKEGESLSPTAQVLREMQKQSSESTVGESLPTDIKLGSFTALNTDRYLFYSFYARIEEQVRFRWENRLQQAINYLNRRLLEVSSENDTWTTEVEFLLYPDGKLHSAQILRKSGIHSFDMSAIEAFKEARVFPNPPREMVKEDGWIHLRFSFSVNYEPRKMVSEQ